MNIGVATMFYTLTTTTTSPDSRCPRCNYCLHGLAPRGRCPECGFEYDERTWVWRPTKVWPFYLQHAVVSVGLFGTVFRGMRELWHALCGVPVSSFDLVLFAITAPFFAYFSLRMYQLERRGRSIAVTGTFVETHLSLRSRHIELAEIVRAEHKVGGARLMLRNGRKVRLFATLDPREEGRLVREINEHINQHNSEAPCAASLPA